MTTLSQPRLHAPPIEHRHNHDHDHMLPTNLNPTTVDMPVQLGRRQPKPRPLPPDHSPLTPFRTAPLALNPRKAQGTDANTLNSRPGSRHHRDERVDRTPYPRLRLCQLNSADRPPSNLGVRRERLGNGIGGIVHCTPLSWRIGNRRLLGEREPRPAVSSNLVSRGQHARALGGQGRVTRLRCAARRGRFCSLTAFDCRFQT